MNETKNTCQDACQKRSSEMFWVSREGFEWCEVKNSRGGNSFNFGTCSSPVRGSVWGFTLEKSGDWKPLLALLKAPIHTISHVDEKLLAGGACSFFRRSLK